MKVVVLAGWLAACLAFGITEKRFEDTLLGKIHLLANKKDRSLTEFLRDLKKESAFKALFQDLDLITHSNSEERADVSLKTPRGIAFQKNLFIAFTTKKDGKFYERMQAIEYLPEKGEYQSLELDFKKTVASKQRSDLEVGSCISCHGPRFRPQWGDYAFWPESFEGRFDMYEDFFPDERPGVKIIGSGASSFANKFRAEKGKELCGFAESDERLTLFADSVTHQCDYLLERKQMPEFRIEGDAPHPYHSSSTYSKTRRLTDTLGLTFVQSMMFALNKAFSTKEERERFGPALAGALYSCGNYEGFFPKEWKNWIDAKGGKRLGMLQSEVVDFARGDFQRRLGLLLFNENTSNLEKRILFKMLPMETSGHSINPQLYRSIAALRYFVELNPTNSKHPFVTKSFGLSRAKGQDSLALNQTGPGEHNRFVEYHALLKSWDISVPEETGYQSFLYSRDCNQWQEASLERLGNVKPPPR